MPFADVMFVGEAPGRLGADRTAVPFHGDKSGDNFERLLELAGFNRKQVFITNAVLCNPRDDGGNNAPPSRETLLNCSKNLADQIAVVQPKIVVTLGAAALESTRLIERHDLKLSQHVRTASEWLDRKLVPLYHPGARAMIHRNFATQTVDYYFVREQVQRLSGIRRKSRTQSKPTSAGWDIVRYIIARLGVISLFKLHKIMYLVDFESIKVHGEPITDFFYIRQKDGPYCVELGSKWYNKYDDIVAGMHQGRPVVRWYETGLFKTVPNIPDNYTALVDRLVGHASSLSEAQIKTRSYLTAPMKASLRAERRGLSQLNRPLL